MIEDYKSWLEKLKNGEPEDVIDQFLSPPPVPPESPKGEAPVLKPGGPGILGCMTRSSDTKGHFEATQEVLQEIKNEDGSPLLRPDAIKSIARASRLPDLMYFKDVRYHAQSDVNKKYIPINSDEDKKTFQGFLRENIDIALEALKKTPCTKFFFHFGITLHMVQDLAAHQGMSNPEHACLDLLGVSPDKSKQRFELAKSASRFLIREFFIEPLKENAEQLNSSPPEKWQEFETVKSFLKLGTAALSFELDPLKERDEEYISRWFRWVEGNSLEKALQQIQQIIRPN